MSATMPEHVSEQGIALIQKFEGFSAIPYRCPAGILTIGYGHVIREGEAYPQGCITQEHATEILKQDVRIAEQAVRRLIRVPLTQNQFDALVSFTFNLGESALARSSLRRKLNKEDYAVVPAEIRRWVYASGKPLYGLTRRRMEEATLFQGA